MKHAVAVRWRGRSKLLGTIAVVAAPVSVAVVVPLLLAWVAFIATSIAAAITIIVCRACVAAIAHCVDDTSAGVSASSPQLHHARRGLLATRHGHDDLLNSVHACTHARTKPG